MPRTWVFCGFLFTANMSFIVRRTWRFEQPKCYLFWRRGARAENGRPKGRRRCARRNRGDADAAGRGAWQGTQGPNTSRTNRRNGKGGAKIDPGHLPRADSNVLFAQPRALSARCQHSIGAPHHRRSNKRLAACAFSGALATQAKPPALPWKQTASLPHRGWPSTLRLPTWAARPRFLPACTFWCAQPS